jgi:8-oxo-dGTP diphosphatase
MTTEPEVPGEPTVPAEPANPPTPAVPAGPGRVFVAPEIYYATLPACYVAAGALITDGDGRILLVKPNYRDYWLLPGGTADEGESPDVACARELREEIGLDLDPGPLLVVDWTPAGAERPRSALYFVFDAGTVDDPARIRLGHDELDAYAFVDLAEAGNLAPLSSRRLAAAVTARATGRTVYLPRA